MPKRSLLTGVAYHGNRMPSHVRADMEEICRADMDIVVHMFSHTDWERHKRIMQENFRITESYGLDVWVDNWGIGGAPGDRSHFLGYHPEAHMVYSNGEMHPYQVCLNAPSYRQFVREWLDTVAEMGGKTIFWDEPFIPTKRAEIQTNDAYTLIHDAAEAPRHYCCCCDTCKKKFEERYNRPMPEFLTPETEEFRTDTIVEFFAEITEYSHSLGLNNAACVMLGANLGINLDSISRICSLPHLDNIGSDPYWLSHKDLNSVYEFVYDNTKKSITNSDSFGKDHNIWIQTYKTPMGREEEIIEATEAAYDAGARTLLAWGYRGSESNDYAAQNPERVWAVTKEAMLRVRSMERDRILAENRKKYMK